MKRIPHLVPGDTVCVLAPAKAIEKDHVDFSVKTLENWGLKVVVSTNCLGRDNYFSGSIEERRSDFQNALDDKNIKAIICARGGYGCVQIVDLLDWTAFVLHPKWVVGFSDVTVLHQRIQNLGFESLHATMPLNFKDNTDAALISFKNHLFNEDFQYSIAPSKHNKVGAVTGKIVGGNLSVLFGLIGTNDQIDFKGKILFIEDLAEYKYAIDRMFYGFKKAGILDQISGLVIGGMTNIKDSDPSFGCDLETLILNHFANIDIPIAFSFPAGHFNDNQSIILGREVRLKVLESLVDMSYS